jgi:hypothetical protein
MTGVVIRLAIRTFVAMVVALGGLTDQGLAADLRESGGLTEVHDATPATEPDLDALRVQLRTTPAINVLTKLALKLRFDELVEDFRGFHTGRRDHNLDDLRRRFANLLDETMRLVRNGDSALFWELQEAQAGLWQTFSNPVKFAALAGDSKITQPLKREHR